MDEAADGAEVPVGVLALESGKSLQGLLVKPAVNLLRLVMAFGDGGFVVTASPSEVLFERLRSDGDFRVRGFLTIDPGRMRIGRAEAELAVPAAFEENMETLRNFLPLVKEGDGRWFLRRASSEGGEGR